MTENQTSAPERTAPARESIYAALAKAQAEFAPVLKNRANSFLKSSYADLQSILDAVRPSLNRHGLALMQRVGTTQDAVTVETVIVHQSGESISSGVLAMRYAKTDKMSLAQTMGSALTYARRYSLSAFLGVTAEDDDDGNAAGAPAPAEQAPAFVLTQAMVDEAQRAAKGGVEAYKRYYQARPEQERTELTKTGWHKQCYEAAKAIDAARSAS